MPEVSLPRRPSGERNRAVLTAFVMDARMSKEHAGQEQSQRHGVVTLSTTATTPWRC
jgi:hypothetical protein